MQKIPTLFVRDEQDRRHVTEQVTPGCEWVLAGEGVATRKYDGMCVLLDDDGTWWARREVKPGKATPADFRAVGTDEVTGKTVGWEPAAQSSFAKYITEAVLNLASAYPKTGTYELIGPKVNGNPEHRDAHELIRHDDADRIEGVSLVPLDFAAAQHAVLTLRETYGWEGIVWHHPDGRMAKLKARDFPR
jgi:hypothetical protein